MTEVKNNVFRSFALEFNQTFFYSYFLQIILISYMYNSIGNGRYWRVLFYGSLLGFFGALMEHTFIAWQDNLPENEKDKTSLSILLLIAEVGWIATEFAVPVLNLIKLNSLSNVAVVKGVTVITALLFCGFSFFRFQIGYSRYGEHKVDCQNCSELHSKAFGVMAITDVILSIMIFFRINKSSREYKIKKNNENISILTTFKKSSVFSLLIVDVISIFLSLTYISPSTSEYAKPFHALKSNFLLILAIDAFIFKFRAHTSGGSTYKSYNDMHSSNIAQSVQSVNNITTTSYKPQKSMLNSTMGKVPSSTTLINTHQNINNFNLSSSQPIINNNYNKTFGLFKNELLSKDTEINIESPKPTASSAINTKYNTSPFMYNPSMNDRYSSDGNISNINFSNSSMNPNFSNSSVNSCGFKSPDMNEYNYKN